ncbi:MAG: helix-turn-helix domain-containing protein [Bacilli bacterium]|nr:helix-turn-helix domain-containing protein [Bacilli bacterium]
MRTRKKELVSDNLKPFVGNLIKENRLKYNYSLEDLSKAINHQKNRQTLHKYETGMLNIPYDLFFEICRIFNIDTSVLSEVDITEEERKKLESKFVKEYISSTRVDKNLNTKNEKIINTYKNANYEPLVGKSELTIKVLDDSMSPYYLKNDRIFFEKQEDYKNGDDIVIATKSNILSVRKLYKYPKGIILQAMNPKYPSLNVNIMSPDMILGKVIAIHREIK